MERHLNRCSILLNKLYSKIKAELSIFVSILVADDPKKDYTYKKRVM